MSSTSSVPAFHGSSAETDTEAYGWTAVPSSFNVLLALRTEEAQQRREAKPTKVDDIPLPPGELAAGVVGYVTTELPPETLAHSLRVYYFGIAIAKYAFPSWLSSSFSYGQTGPFEETYYLTCLLHDIGTTEKNITATRMSFEFYGGYLALNLLKARSAETAQAESVAEAIIRHQDLGETGTLTRIGALIQLATIYDNMGIHSELIHPSLLDDVIKHHPRQHWSTCFAETIRRENSLKPWAHTTHLGEEEFPDGVLGNVLVAKYE